MKPKKIPMKVHLTRDCIIHFGEISPVHAPSGVAGMILEATKGWKGTLVELMYHIQHSKPT